MLQCFDEEMSHRKCLRKHKNIAMDFVRGTTESVTSAMCTEYDETSDKCQSLPPIDDKIKPDAYKYDSVAFALIDLFNSL